MDNALMYVLNAREERWRLRLTLAERGAVLTITQNIPGPDKLLPRWLALHEAVINDFVLFLTNRGFEWQTEPGASGPSLERRSAAGAEAHFVFGPFPADAAVIKRAAVEFEERHPAGRLADIDVMARGGIPVERAGLGLPPRLCLLCGSPAKECASRRRHPLKEIMEEAERIIGAFESSSDNFSDLLRGL